MRNIKIFLFLIILVHILFIYFSADQLYYGDEVIFIEAAREISQGQAAGRFSHLDGRLNPDVSNMLIHPPTYIYLLSLFILLFGENTYSMRAVSSLFAVGVIILIFLITKRILEKREIENSEKWALFAALLYAISPIAVQNSILIDIDGGLLNFFILLFIYFYISEKNLYYLVPALFMVFASKLIGGVVLFASLLLINLLTFNFGEILRITKLFLIAGISFFLVFFAYTKIFNLNWYPLFFHSSIFGILKNLIADPYLVLARSLWSMKTFFYFATPFLIFLFIIVSFNLIRNAVKYKNYISENKDLFLLWFYAIITLLVVLIAGVSGWSFAKYHIAAVPSAIILLIYFTPKKIKNIKKIIPLIIITTFILSFYFIFFLNDPLIPEVQGRVKTHSFSEVAKPVLIRSFMYAIIPIFLCIGLIKRIPKKRFWLVFLFLLIFTSLYLDILQARADYSTHNLYGDRGLEQVIEYMKDKPADKILGYVHVGYFLDYENTFELSSIYYSREKLNQLILEEDIKWIILYEKDITLIGGEILRDFELEKQIGDYKILERQNNLT